MGKRESVINKQGHGNVTFNGNLMDELNSFYWRHSRWRVGGMQVLLCRTDVLLTCWHIRLEYSIMLALLLW